MPARGQHHTPEARARISAKNKARSGRDRAADLAAAIAIYQAAPDTLATEIIRRLRCGTSYGLAVVRVVRRHLGLPSQARGSRSPQQRARISDGLRAYYGQHPEARGIIGAEVRARHEARKAGERSQRAPANSTHQVNTLHAPTVHGETP